MQLHGGVELSAAAALALVLLLCLNVVVCVRVCVWGVYYAGTVEHGG